MAILTLLVYAVGTTAIVLGVFTAIVGLRQMRKGERVNGSWIMLIGLVCMSLGTMVIGFFRFFFFWVGGGYNPTRR